jgi:hypothetical protein
MEARVTLLGAAGEQCSGTIQATEADRSELLTDRKLEPGQLVQIECEGATLLGEVQACRPASGGYAVAVEVEHVVGAAQLAQLLRALSE